MGYVELPGWAAARLRWLPGLTGLEAGSMLAGPSATRTLWCLWTQTNLRDVPMQGHELVSGQPEADLAVCGPLARSAEDLTTALSIMAGPAEREAMVDPVNCPTLISRLDV